MKVAADKSGVLIATDDNKETRAMSLEQYKKHARDAAFVATIAPADVTKIQTEITKAGA